MDEGQNQEKRAEKGGNKDREEGFCLFPCIHRFSLKLDVGRLSHLCLCGSGIDSSEHGSNFQLMICLSRCFPTKIHTFQMWDKGDMSFQLEM